MSRIVYLSLSVICFCALCSCNPLKTVTKDVNGWDVSACVDGFSVCWDLFRDNQDKFQGGFTSAMDSISPKTK